MLNLQTDIKMTGTNGEVKFPFQLFTLPHSSLLNDYVHLFDMVSKGSHDSVGPKFNSWTHHEAFVFFNLYAFYCKILLYPTRKLVSYLKKNINKLTINSEIN